MIFCVEDDSSIRDLMIYTLNTAGFEAHGFSEGNSLMEALKENTPELIMLDIMLPGDDGITLLKKLKSQNRTAAIPVIMASAKGAEYDKVIGLDLGADDYLAKPFGMMEMISRVKAVLRRTAPKETPQVMRVGNLELSLSEHTVEAEGKRVELTFKEFELLKLFLPRPRAVCSCGQSSPAECPPLTSTAWRSPRASPSARVTRSMRRSAMSAPSASTTPTAATRSLKRASSFWVRPAQSCLRNNIGGQLA